MIGVIVFIKNPALGKVKTRLASSAGDEEALDIYLQLLDHTRRVMEDLSGVRRYVFYSDYIDENDAFSPDLFEKKLQHSGDLGDRIKDAFTAVFEDCEKAIIIGSDCAQMAPVHIHRSIALLEEKDTVIGPTLDGGYYLLGINGNYTSLFEDIDWSTEKVYQQTIEKAVSLSISHEAIDILSDIDYIEDWNKYGFHTNPYYQEKSNRPMFINDQVHIDEVPSMDTLEYTGMEKNMLKSDIISTVVFFAVGYIILAVLHFVFNIEWIGDYGLYIAAGLTFLLAVSLVYTYFEFFKRSYAIRSKDIIYNKGLFWRSSIVIPYNRVQHCEVSQGPIDRYFKLAELKIFTAGGASSDLNIEGLSPQTANRIKDFIVSKTAMDEEE